VNTLDLTGASDPNPLRKWFAPVGGLLTAVAVSDLFCRLHPMRFVSWNGLIGSAAMGVLAVSLASAATMWGLRHIGQDAITRSAQRLILRTSLAASWLAPLALFLCEKSLWAIPVAALFLASVTRSLHALKDRSGTAEYGVYQALSLSGYAPGTLDSSLQFRRLCSACAAALCAEVGVIAGFIGYTFTAATMVGVSSAVVTWFALEAHACSQQSRVLAGSSSRVLLALAFAIVFTAAGLAPYAAHARHRGGFGMLSETTNLGHGSTPSERLGQPDRETAPRGSASEFAEAHPGVVLWPKKKTYTALVAPAPLLSSSSFSNGRSSDPLVIPFNGVYWFFQAPEMRPPRGSREVFGAADRFDTHSNNQRPLSMEAHQNLGTLIDLDCCSRIQLGIRNADRHPGTVALELILTDTSLPGKPHQSLGKVMVKSTQPWRLYDNRPPVAETLSFQIPAHAAIHRFDELTIVFDMEFNRSEFAAKMAIERFVLVPRGL
jgi:hypothetical protein